MRRRRCADRLGFALLDKLWTILLICMGVMLLIACDAKTLGPAERTGMETEKAVPLLGDKVEKAGARLKEGRGGTGA